MDIIINDPGIAAAATETQVKAAIGANGINLGTFPAADLSADEQTALINTLYPLKSIDIQTGFCAQFGSVIPNNCTAADLQDFVSKGETILAAPVAIGAVLGYTADSDPNNILIYAADVGAKSAAFDSKFTVVTGVAATNIVPSDVSLFGTHADIHGAYTSILQSIGATVNHDSSFVLQPQNAPAVQSAVSTQYATNVASGAAAASALTALGVAPLPAVSTPDLVQAQINLLVPPVRALLTKLAVPTSAYSANKLTDVVNGAIPAMSQILSYQKAMVTVKLGCAQYLTGVTSAGLSITAPHIALYNGCTSFNAAIIPSKVLKNVCGAVYYYVGGMFIVPSVSPFSGAPQIIQKGCEFLNGAPNANGTGALAFNYGAPSPAINVPAGFTHTFSSWSGFSGFPQAQFDFFDAVSSSAYAWVS